jgi:hypothetical protein
MKQNTTADDAPSEKNDLYSFLGDELTNGNGKSLGTLTRVRAAYDFCEFETLSGKTVRRDVSDVIDFANGAYDFN